MLKIDSYFHSLEEYLSNEEFKGWDPFDGLNSKVFQNTIFRKFYYFRLLWLQLFKISPINFRRLFKVPKEYNPKGLALILTAYCNKYIAAEKKKDEDLKAINNLIILLKSLKSSGYSGSCWGYNFDWQARAFFQPKGTPTVVATSFIANAFLDAYEITEDKSLLDEARSSCDFILKDLNRTFDNEDNFCFSYSPLDKTQVFNASALASRLLSRVYSYTNEDELKISAKKSIDFCLKYQRLDGAWPYGTLPYHQWVDSFHTGYMIECMSDYQKFTDDTSYDEVIIRSLNYYLEHFFEKSGMPKYYDTRVYPVDIHAPAQLIVTLFRTKKIVENIDLVDSVLGWVNSNMWSSKGYYYYQKRRFWTSKIPYIRWTQAWMFYAFSFYLRERN